MDITTEASASVPRSTDMGKPLFYGEHDELQGLWFHMKLKTMLDPSLSDSEQKKCAYLASCFQGRALVWLEERFNSQPEILDNYNALQASVNEAFDLPEAVKERIAEKRIMQLKQTGAVLHYLADFDALVTKLSWPASAKKALFFVGLKPHLQEKLILNNLVDTYDEMKDEAIRLDAALSQAKTPAKKAGKGKGTHKCAKCGRTNHETKDCFAKPKAVQVLSYEGASPPEPSNYIEALALQGRTLKALVDTGAKINAIRASLATTQQYPSDITPVDATGRPFSQCLTYIEDSIDGVIQRLYLIPGLQEEVILGEPYLAKGTGIRTFSVDLTGPIPEGGRIRQLSSLEQQAQDEFIETRLAEGKIRPSHAAAAATLLFVPKKDHTLRTVVDFRRLNSVTKRDGYALPLLKECLSRARGHTHYCVIDLERAFDLLGVRRGDEWKLAFKTNRGTYEFLVMPQGVTNGPSFFQRYIDSILPDFRQFCTVYIDDILVWANSEDMCEARVELIKQRLADHRIGISEKKYRGVDTSAVFLGMMISQHNITPLIDIEAIRSWPEPANVTDLQQFLGLANWHRDFVPQLSQLTAPLNPLTGNTAWRWESHHALAFGRVCDALCHSMATYNYDQTKPSEWYTDASLFGLGGIHMQEGRVVSIISRGLTPAERNYTTTEREMLAIVHAAKKWRHYLESSTHPTIIHTDHQALTQSLNPDGTNRRINRWMEFLMTYRLDLRFVAGKQNPADAPSRRPDYVLSAEGGGYDWKFSEDNSSGKD